MRSLPMKSIKAALFLAGLLIGCSAIHAAPAATNPAPKPLVVEIKNASGQNVGLRL